MASLALGALGSLLVPVLGKLITGKGQAGGKRRRRRRPKTIREPVIVGGRRRRLKQRRLRR